MLECEQRLKCEKVCFELQTVLVYSRRRYMILPSVRWVFISFSLSYSLTTTLGQGQSNNRYSAWHSGLILIPDCLSPLVSDGTLFIFFISREIVLLCILFSWVSCLSLCLPFYLNIFLQFCSVHTRYLVTNWRINIVSDLKKLDFYIITHHLIFNSLWKLYVPLALEQNIDYLGGRDSSIFLFLLDHCCKYLKESLPCSHPF